MNGTKGRKFTSDLAKLLGQSANDKDIKDADIDEMLDATSRALGFIAALKANGCRSKADDAIYLAEEIAFDTAHRKIDWGQSLRSC